MLELSRECADKPDVQHVIEHDFYVDDLNTGSDSKQELKNVVHEVVNKLSEACFPLCKFRTNAPDILKDLPLTNICQDFSKESTVLGLKWYPQTDTLKFSTEFKIESAITKRNILSMSSKIFDPLGLLSATTIIPKIILQRLWLLKNDWDEEVPNNIKLQWEEFIKNLHHISVLEVPRHIVCPAPINVEFHCFTDASQTAYGACLYLKSKDALGVTHVHLFCAKAKVAPLKPELTVPRLELMGALLGARLLTRILHSLSNKQFETSRAVLWTDSTIVLGWINTQPKTLKTFVCNRIQEIRELTAQHEWRYVPTQDNPADLASRGVKPQDLKNNYLWWHGASFLSKPEDEWPQQIINLQNNTLPEMKVSLTIQCKQSFISFEKFSKLSKLQRILSYVQRFIYNCKNKNNKLKGKLTLQELQTSLKTLAKTSQTYSFEKDIHSLKTTGVVNCKSNILSLNPFLDSEGILRVGGRIQGALQPYNKIHPILIDSKHTFTKLLFAEEHLRLLHCGPQQLLSLIRENFWPVGGRVLATQTVNKCVKCVRLKGKSVQTLMGNLPQSRVNPSSPFEICGTDFAGPFHISNRKGRGARTNKCYLCLFVCFSSKALHLEVVSELSTNAFISCLRRFISRRGKPRIIYCDNGRNYVGANNELGRMLKAANEPVTEFGASEGIEFKFSPAYAPNFGGIWEAGVKAAKFHLKRIAGNSNLTFEEISTLFTQIEAILNSRPLTPMSSDPSDFNPLTPGHFLIGRPLTSLASPSVEKLSINRYQHLERLRQHFWKRWSQEFLSELQQRVKWRRSSGQPIKVGDVVVIKDEHLPPMKWILGRVEKRFFGPDGSCRVADITTNKGTFRRALNKVCILPVNDPELLESTASKGAEDVNNTTL